MNKDYAHSMQDDLISRQAAIGEAKNLHYVAWANYKEIKISASTMIDALKNLPSAYRQGEWIIHDEVKNIYGGIYIECSECGTKFVTQTLEDEHFCRNCGAYMKGENK